MSINALKSLISTNGMQYSSKEFTITIFERKCKKSVNVPKCWINQIFKLLFFDCVIISDLHLFQETVFFFNSCFTFSKNLILSLIDQ